MHFIFLHLFSSLFDTFDSSKIPVHRSLNIVAVVVGFFFFKSRFV